MANDLIPTSDLEGLTRAIGAVINPIAQSQGEAQKRAIDADVEKFRIATAAGERRIKFSFALSLTLLLIVAGVVAGFMLAGQYQFAFNALAFAGGTATGYGIGRVQRGGGQ